MFAKAGFDYKLGKFNAIYNRAKEVENAYDDRVSVRSFQAAVSEMHNIE